jgi:hypothetical protein
MRFAFLLLVACTEHGKGGGGVFDSGISSCDPAPDAGCPAGPQCGVACCGQGESCEEGVCTCGGGRSCVGGDVCASLGPSDDVCGATCCGSTSNPCPL